MTVPLIWRRAGTSWVPLVVFGAVTAGAFISIGHASYTGIAAIMVAAYSVGAYCRWTLASLAVLLATAFQVANVFHGTNAPEVPNSIAPFVLSKDRQGNPIQYQGRRGTYAAMADGSVRFIDQNVADDVFKAMCTVSGPTPSNFNLDKIENTPLVPPPQPPEAKEEKDEPTAKEAKEGKEPMPRVVPKKDEKKDKVAPALDKKKADAKVEQKTSWLGQSGANLIRMFGSEPRALASGGRHPSLTPLTLRGSDVPPLANARGSDRARGGATPTLGALLPV